MAQNAYFPENFTGATDKEKLTNAFASLVSGNTLKLKPNKVYTIDYLEISNKDNLTIDGQGSEIVLTDTTKWVKVINSTNITIKNLKVTMITSVRNYASGITLENVSGFLVENCVVDGSNATGIICWNCSNGMIRNNVVKNTLADGIHMTAESKHIKVYGNKLENTADDGIAVVSYTHNTGYCENISIYENYVGQSQARGISVVGGKDISVRNNFTYETWGAGIYSAMEDASPSYSTYNCVNVEIMYNTIEKASDYDYPVSNMSSIFVRNDDSLNPHDNIQIIDNTIIGGTKQAINVVRTKQLKIKGNRMKDIIHHFIEVYRVENSIIVENIGNMVGLIDFNGIFIRESNKVTTAKNILNDVGSRGIYVLGTTTVKSENIHVESNLITNPNTTNTTKDGILIDYVVNVLVANNNVQATNTLRCAVLVTANVSGSVVVDNNAYSDTTYTSPPIFTSSINTIKGQTKK